MGAEISKGANGLGSIIGSAFAASFKSIFAGSCEDICSGPWDVTCFIEHFCISSLVKSLMILILCYATLFFYRLFKLGICQCIGRSLCKMCWVGCETYWFALEGITCYLWHKLINTKRVYRGRHHFQDVELGYSSTDESDPSYNCSQVCGKGKSFREGRESSREGRDDRLQNSLYLSSRHGSIHNHHHHLARLKRRSRRSRSSRQGQLSEARNQHGKGRIFKRRRLK